MKNMLSIVASAALAVTAFAPVVLVPVNPAVAASPAQDYCEDVLYGYYEKIGGKITCTVINNETTGANGHGQGIEVTVYTYTNGTWNNDPQAGGSSNCDGPGGSGDKSNHCG